MNDQVRIPQWLVLDVFLLSHWVSPVSQLRGWVLPPGSGCQAGERDLAAPRPVCSLSCHLLSPVSSLLNTSAGYAGIELISSEGHQEVGTSGKQREQRE